MRNVLGGLVVALASMTMLAGPALAEFTVGGEDGWSLSVDGNVNAFAIYTMGDSKPEFNGSIDRRVDGFEDDQDSFRVMTGFAPGWLGFTMRAPTIGGLDMKSRISFCPTYTAKDVGKSKNSFSNQIDLREIYFTVDGNFGQFLVGKTMSIYQRYNLVTDFLNWGMGYQGGVNNGNATAGRIGFGYVYPQYNAAVVYTTPSFNGLQLTVGVYDPSVIKGSGAEADETDTPRFEGELSYARTFGDVSFKTWVSGLYQEAEYCSGSGYEGDVTAAGVAGGIQIKYRGFDLSVSGFDGSGLGSLMMLDSDSLDIAGEERDGHGYFAQLTYAFDNGHGNTTLGVSYGGNMMDETSADKVLRRTGTEVQLEERNMLTFIGIYDINKYLKLVAEFSFAEMEWFDGEDQQVQYLSFGTFFNW